jgi:cytochrome c oxidase subunit 3
MALATEHAEHPYGHSPDERVYHQFEDYDQQTESYVVGMWCFLVTEVMFFGALFFAYTLYRWKYQPDFFLGHKVLNVPMGATNTMVLLTSSFSMALAVHYAQIKQIRKQQMALAFTVACAFAFLVIKAFEWTEKFKDHHVMGPGFRWDGGGSPAHVQMFFSLYFGMTGLHAFHVIIGILVIGALMFMTKKNYPSVRDYIPTEMVGLYWHFVDIVWIFLFPLYYLMPQ